MKTLFFAMLLFPIVLSAQFDEYQSDYEWLTIRGKRIYVHYHAEAERTARTVAKIDDVPAQLLKNIFLRESQLWPGIYNSIKEVGLGHLTDNGADTILLWNPDFFN